MQGVVEVLAKSSFEGAAIHAEVFHNVGDIQSCGCVNLDVGNDGAYKGVVDTGSRGGCPLDDMHGRHEERSEVGAGLSWGS